MFQFRDPIAQPVHLGEDVYRVIGVLSNQGSGNATPGAVGQQDMNDDIYIPLSCARNRFGEVQQISSAGSRSFERTQLNEITLQVADSRRVSQTAGMVRVLLEQSHPNQDDFRLGDSVGIAQACSRGKTNLESCARLYRGYLAARWWNRYYEHHAGERDGTHARNWRSSGTRREAKRHHVSVSRGDRVCLSATGE